MGSQSLSVNGLFSYINLDVSLSAYPLCCHSRASVQPNLSSTPSALFCCWKWTMRLPTPGEDYQRRECHEMGVTICHFIGWLPQYLLTLWISSVLMEVAVIVSMLSTENNRTFWLPTVTRIPLNGSYGDRVGFGLPSNLKMGFKQVFSLFPRHPGRSWEATWEHVGCWALPDPLAILVLPMKLPEELPRRQMLLLEKHPLQPGICPVIALQEKVNSSVVCVCVGGGAGVDGAWLSSVGMI